MLQAQSYAEGDENSMERGQKYENYQNGFLDLKDILYPQSTSKQNSPVNVNGQQILSQKALKQNRNNQQTSHVRMQDKQPPLSFEGNRRNTQNSEVGSLQFRKRVDQRNKQSVKHNFPKHLVRKVKDVMKTILKIKKREKIERITNLRQLYFYLFHETLKKHQNLDVFQIFLHKQSQQQQTKLRTFLKNQMYEHGIEQNIDQKLIQSLKQQLRKRLIQQENLILSLIQKGSINRKEQFKYYVIEFFIGLKQEYLKPSE